MSDRKLSRRAFARGAATVAAAAVTLKSQLFSQTPPPPTPPAPPSSTPPIDQKDADSRYAQVLARYGSRLSEEQKNDIRRLINGGQGGLDAVRAYPIDNSVQPGITLDPLALRGSKR